ncbi:hypothetical protein [Streptomyces pseudogriseolus]|uniref:hypothetical protein n=1 Tax=Streptomyces pseudogriseolus TaxID=36817 RepID=UPI003FA2172F
MADYGKAYAAILCEMVTELARSKRVDGRQQKRIANARIGAWRTSLLLILQTEHGMTEAEAEKAVLESVQPWRAE